MEPKLMGYETDTVLRLIKDVAEKCISFLSKQGSVRNRLNVDLCNCAATSKRDDDDRGKPIVCTYVVVVCSSISFLFCVSSFYSSSHRNKIMLLACGVSFLKYLPIICFCFAFLDALFMVFWGANYDRFKRINF